MKIPKFYNMIRVIIKLGSKEENEMENAPKNSVDIDCRLKGQNSTVSRKNYSSPELTEYGGISDLVLGVVVVNVDGPLPNPPFDAIS